MYSFWLNDDDELMQEFYEDKDFRREFFGDLKNDDKIYECIAGNKKNENRKNLMLQQKINRIGLLTKLVDTTIEQNKKYINQSVGKKNEESNKLKNTIIKVEKKRKVRKTFIEKYSSTFLKRDIIEQKIKKNKIQHNNDGECCCNCKKSQCLKLYCVCFASKRYCNAECNCRGCSNLEIFIAEIKKAQEIVLKKDKSAFDAKIKSKEHTKGCHCKRSRCLKKYCECFQSNVYCNDICGCVKDSCQNFEGSECLEKMFGKKKNGVGPRNMLVTSQPLRGVKT